MGNVFLRWAGVTGAMFASGSVAMAQSAATAANGTETQVGVVAITSENDLFGGTDRNYSNGIRAEFISRPDRAAGIFRTVADYIPGLTVDRTIIRQGFGIAHAIFTPEDISLVEPDPTDRPYAGWLAVSGTIIANDADTQDSLQINLGVVGPSAAGKFIQTNWHELIDGVEPQGWDSQLEDELGVEIVAQRQQVFLRTTALPFGLEADAAYNFGGSLGNVRTYADIGIMMRFGGTLDAKEFGPPRIRPALAGAGGFEKKPGFGGYVFAGFQGRAVARDIFLDGNTDRDSARVDDRRDLVADFQAGTALHYKSLQVSFTYVHRTEQFVAQDGPQRFGAISVALAY
ncbi:MAG: lipid A deacylase LpxR family protein [Pseudomonadota bacterium]